MTNTIMKKTMFGNKKMALVFLTAFAVCLLFILFAGATTAQAATSANTAKESASTEKKLTLLEKMENEADEKTITVGKTDLKSELGVTSTQAALAKVSKSYAKSLLGKYGYENVSGNTYETQYPFSRIFIDGTVTDKNSDYSVTNAGITILQYSTPEEAALAANDFEDDGYEVFGDTVLEVEFDTSSSSSGSGYATEYMSLLDNDCYSSGNEEVIVAVIDSGVNTDVFDEDRFLYSDNDELVYYNVTTEENTDSDGHGTKVSSVIINNTGDNIKILPIKFSGSKKIIDGYTLYESSALCLCTAFEYVKAEGADVVNMSFKMYSLKNEDDYSDEDRLEATEELNEIVGPYMEQLTNEGVSLICSAGNDSESSLLNLPRYNDNCWVISAID